MDRLDATKLSQAENKLRFDSGCSHVIPEEFAHSIPIPFKIKKRKEMGFKILFYPVVTEAETPSMASSPFIEGVFALDGSVSDHCIATTDQNEKVLKKNIPAALSMASYYKDKSFLYENLERIAPLYFDNSSPASGDIKNIGAFVREFKRVSEPALWPDYYRLSPDFWNWIKKNGQTLPAPAPSQ